MRDWTYIRKGDILPVGDVLVARLQACDTAEARLLAAIFSDEPKPPQHVVTVAHWNKGRKRWQHGPRGEEVGGVYAWMPLPSPPEPR